MVQRYKEKQYPVFQPCRIVFILTCNRLHNNQAGTIADVRLNDITS